ncbi:MAG TPA: amidohydrolase family protein [Planctomycetaceae bacterium]|nr:amidohydrolase family protein [Planctomycetaceae bacterium]
MSRPVTRRSFLGTVGAAGASAALASHAAQAGAADSTAVIDCHVHLKHGDAARTEWSPEAIIDIMDKAGIDKSVVFAMSTTTARSIEMAKTAVKKYPKRLIPFLYALPSYERPVLKEIESAISDDAFRGIKIHAGECTLAEYIIDPVIRLAGSFPVPCLIDAAGNSTVAARLAEAFPHTPLLLAHMGRYLSTDPALVEQFIRVAEKFENVYLDLSAVALVYKIEEAAQRLGATRLVWGTDGPYKNPDLVTYARTEMDKVRQLKISDADKQLILGGNIARMLNLEA